MVAYTAYATDARPRREAEALAGRGDSVDFIALAEEGKPSREQMSGVNVIRVPLQRYRGQGARKYAVSYLRFFLAVTARLVVPAVKQSYDVVYVHTMPDAMVFVALLPKLLGAKVVLDVHDTMPELYMSKFSVSANHLLIRLLRLQEQVSCLFADRIICVHEPHRNLLLLRGVQADKVAVVLNVPDPAIFDRGKLSRVGKGDGFRIVFHGTVADRLGLDVALRALQIVLAVIPEARLEIHGDGDGADRVEQAIEDLQLRNSVMFSRTFIPVQEVPGLLEGAALGVVPNRRDAATEYMLPVKLLEYAHMGIPVVCARLPTVEYYFGEDSVAFFEAGNHEELAQCIVELARDEEKRQDLARRSQMILEELSWETVRQGLFAAVDGR